MGCEKIRVLYHLSQVSNLIRGCQQQSRISGIPRSDKLSDVSRSRKLFTEMIHSESSVPMILRETTAIVEFDRSQNKRGQMIASLRGLIMSLPMKLGSRCMLRCGLVVGLKLMRLRSKMLQAHHPP